MPYLVAAVVMVGLLCLLDLVLSIGIIRRLREQQAILDRLTGAAVPAGATVPVGGRVGAFTAGTTEGGLVSRTADAARVFGFFSPGCAPCVERIPEFLEYARRRRLAAVAIVVADDAGGQAYVSRLSGAADVVVEPTGGPVGRAFEVTSFPALCLVDPAGTVLASGNVIADLPDLVPV